jgi:hypothetical protein
MLPAIIDRFDYEKAIVDVYKSPHHFLYREDYSESRTYNGHRDKQWDGMSRGYTSLTVPVAFRMVTPNVYSGVISYLTTKFGHIIPLKHVLELSRRFRRDLINNVEHCGIRVFLIAVETILEMDNARSVQKHVYRENLSGFESSEHRGEKLVVQNSSTHKLLEHPVFDYTFCVDNTDFTKTTCTERYIFMPPTLRDVYEDPRYNHNPPIGYTSLQDAPLITFYYSLMCLFSGDGIELINFFGSVRLPEDLHISITADPRKEPVLSKMLPPFFPGRNYWEINLGERPSDIHVATENLVDRGLPPAKRNDYNFFNFIRLIEFLSYMPIERKDTDLDILTKTRSTCSGMTTKEILGDLYYNGITENHFAYYTAPHPFWEGVAAGIFMRHVRNDVPSSMGPKCSLPFFAIRK